MADGTEQATRMTRAEFTAMFPSDDACLEYLRERSYGAGTVCPGCRRPSRFHRIRGRSAYSCQFCGTHVYPTAGTIFRKSRTSLRLWFWAIFLVASTGGRISARELERELGVTYKTAHRMLAQIRALLIEDEPMPARASAVWHGKRRRSWSAGEPSSPS